MKLSPFVMKTLRRGAVQPMSVTCSMLENEHSLQRRQHYFTGIGYMPAARTPAATSALRVI
jgi:hypothetical protein